MCTMLLHVRWYIVMLRIRHTCAIQLLFINSATNLDVAHLRSYHRMSVQWVIHVVVAAALPPTLPHTVVTQRPVVAVCHHYRHPHSVHTSTNVVVLAFDPIFYEINLHMYNTRTTLT
jgi:hypothetical protein